jgi:hydroxymethylbilane synthase
LMPTPSGRTIIVGTRTSALARWQTDHVVALLHAAWPELAFSTKPFVTKGDKSLRKALPAIGGKGLFTAELERALRDGEIDLAVHSLKDLPVANAPGLTVGAIPARAPVRDGLVSAHGEALAELMPGAVVGTSSLRRQAQLLAVRPDLVVKSIRGNVGTRARKVTDGPFDATVLALAGLSRLGMEELVAQTLALDVMLPAPGQGALAVQCRADDTDLLTWLAAIDDEKTRKATTAERLFLQGLGGGCAAPIAAYARVGEGGMLSMSGLIAAPDGARVIRISGADVDPQRLAADLAAAALSQGADTILAALETAAGPATIADPLEKQRIVVTRTVEQAPELAEQLRSLGAEPILFPTIRIAPVADMTALDNAIGNLSAYDWVIFTSVNGVAIFRDRMESLGLGPTIFADVRVAAIGPATGDALAEVGIEPSFIPDEFVAEEIARGLGDVADLRFLLPRAEAARATLAELLEQQGGTVTEIATYRTLSALPDDNLLPALAVADVFTFTSSSTVRNFVDLVGGAREAQRLTANALIACIGPITAGTASEYGLAADIVADTYTMDGLVAALVTHFTA